MRTSSTTQDPGNTVSTEATGKRMCPVSTEKSKVASDASPPTCTNPPCCTWVNSGKESSTLAPSTARHVRNLVAPERISTGGNVIHSATAASAASKQSELSTQKRGARERTAGKRSRGRGGGCRAAHAACPLPLCWLS